MLRRRRGSGNIILWCFVLLLVGFVYGYFTNEDPIKDNPNQVVEEAKIPNIVAENINQEHSTDKKTYNQTDDITTTIENDNIVTNNTKLILKTYYEKTRDTISKEKKLPITLVGRTLDDLKHYLEENYTGWSIREMNKDVVELYQVSNKVSPNHYVIKEYNGYITIFQVDEEGNLKFISQTEISISSLSDVDRQKMNEGIIVKGIDGINQLLEDYSS